MRQEPIKTAIIAAAGQSTRMWPASKVCPKELFPLGKVPVIAHLVAEFLEAGIETITIVVGPHNAQLVRDVFDASKQPPPKMLGDPVVSKFQKNISLARISIIEQHGNYGNGTPLRLLAETMENEPCIYAFGDDVVIGENASLGLIDVYGKTGHSVLCAQEVSSTKKSSFGILECEERNGVQFVNRLIEKPKEGETASSLASFGRYLVTPPLLRTLDRLKPGRDGEVWFTDAVVEFISAGGQVCAFVPSIGEWFTVGDPASYAAAVGAAFRASQNSAGGQTR